MLKLIDTAMMCGAMSGPGYYGMTDAFVTHDVELLRQLLIVLDERQVSPRATVVIVTRDEADELDCDVAAVEYGLNVLLNLDYIEGPGADANGMWLFRKLTRKGVEFLRAARDPSDWDRLKRRRVR